MCPTNALELATPLEIMNVKHYNNNDEKLLINFPDVQMVYLAYLLSFILGLGLGEGLLTLLSFDLK